MQLSPVLELEGEPVPVAEAAAVVGVVPVATVLVPVARAVVVAVSKVPASVVAVVVGLPKGLVGVEVAVAVDSDAKNAER